MTISFINYLTCAPLFNYYLTDAEVVYLTKILFSLKERSCFAMPSNSTTSSCHLTKKGAQRIWNTYANFILRDINYYRYFKNFFLVKTLVQDLVQDIIQRLQNRSARYLHHSGDGKCTLTTRQPSVYPNQVMAVNDFGAHGELMTWPH